MRDILFRGKRTDNGEWVEGYYIHLHNTTYCLTTDNDADPSNDIHQIVFEHMTEWGLPNKHLRADVDPSTVGQYTGLNDKNGKRVFEGDILRIAKKADNLGTYFFPPIEYPVLVFVKFDLCAWSWETISDDKYYIHFPEAWCDYECEVVGNLYDNPELLK